MKTTIIVKSAGPIKRAGCGRIELVAAQELGADALDEHRAKRELTAAVYCVAARLEQIGASDALEFEVSVGKARLGVIEVDASVDGIDDDMLTEILIEACAECGFFPADCEVSS